MRSNLASTFFWLYLQVLEGYRSCVLFFNSYVSPELICVMAVYYLFFFKILLGRAFDDLVSIHVLLLPLLKMLLQKFFSNLARLYEIIFCIRSSQCRMNKAYHSWLAPGSIIQKTKEVSSIKNQKYEDIQKSAKKKVKEKGNTILIVSVFVTVYFF